MLIVISIVGILTSIVIASVTTSHQKARDTRRLSDIKEIQLGLALYFDVYKAYPPDLNTLVTQKFLPSIPTDPTGPSYEYAKLTTTTYCLGASLDNMSSNPGDSSSCSTGGSANYKVSQPQ